MTAVTIFDFEDKSVRTVEIDGAPWFVGKDVCGCLDIGNHRDALGRLDPDERMDGVGITDPIGRQQRPILISEPGVYRLVFTSRTEVAERFKRWLAHDVLPAIRRTGRYEAAPTSDGTLPMLSNLDMIELGQTMRTLREVRLTFGMRAARTLARRLPIPDDISRPPEPIAHDPIGRFADDVIVRTLGARVTAADLYAAYEAWCARQDIAAEHPCRFGRRMTALGIGRLKSGGSTVYTDVDLADDGVDDTDAG